MFQTDNRNPPHGYAHVCVNQELYMNGKFISWNSNRIYSWTRTDPEEVNLWLEGFYFRMFKRLTVLIIYIQMLIKL
jgi:hypothetical protein